MKICVFWIFTLLIASCCPSKQPAGDFGPGSLTVAGTMNRVPLEGGCWQFTSDDGSTYQISGEQAHQLLVDGQRAEIIIRTLPGRRTICMTGTPVELLKIIKIY